MALYGYARVSTADQDCTLQEHALRAAGCEVIRAEKVSATRRAGRTELALLLEFLRRGDTLVVTPGQSHHPKGPTVPVAQPMLCCSPQKLCVEEHAPWLIR